MLASENSTQIVGDDRRKYLAVKSSTKQIFELKHELGMEMKPETAMAWQKTLMLKQAKRGSKIVASATKHQTKFCSQECPSSALETLLRR